MIVERSRFSQHEEVVQDNGLLSIEDDKKEARQESNAPLSPRPTAEELWKQRITNKLDQRSRYRCFLQRDTRAVLTASTTKG